MPQTAAVQKASASGNIVTLPASYYYDPQIYAREKEQLFFKEWMLFCHEALLTSPGQYVAFTIAERPLMVLRAKDGTLKGFHNVCRHRASQVLKEGCGKTEVLRCMYHGWVYDTHGNLCKTPGFGGDEKSLCANTSLFPIHVRTWNGLVFVSMAEVPPSFETTLGDLPAAMQGTDITQFRYHGMATHKINCNWKTYIENYMEGYHIPVVHPALNREVDFATYKVITGDRIARHETGIRADKKEEALNGGLWVWLWPNVALNIYKNGMNLELVIPTGPETMELRYCYLFNDVSPENEAANRKTIDMSFTVTQEDIDICEIVQRNLKANVYTQGELSPRHENGVAYFQQMISNLG